MGCAHTKLKRQSRTTNNRNLPFEDGDIESGYHLHSVNLDDQVITNRISNEFKDNPQIFILNNILMSIMFFENYKKDFEKLANITRSKMEKELNLKLLKNETMNCITPDVVFDKINKNVRFRPLHGPKKEFSEPLLTKRIYVVNDIIDVNDNVLEETPQYTSIDKPSYQVIIEESTAKGFVKLKLLMAMNATTPINQDETVKEPTAGPSKLYQTTILKPIISGQSDSDTYDYTTITDIKTPKPIEIDQQPQRRDTLPKTCFEQRSVKKLENVEESKELYETVSYISSKGFMRYFQSQKFPSSLGRALGFQEMEISLAKSIPGKVFCNLNDADDNPQPCEIIPAVAISWPKQAYGFKTRKERPTVHPINNNGISIKWPTDKMIIDIMSSKCMLVPKGCFQKKGVHSDTDIEWEIQFPRAEKYLETRMTNAQFRCFLFLLAIHKTYIEPITDQHGLLSEHIRCHMFWECEQNYMSWPEHQLGTKLIRVIRNFHTKLSEGRLDDFFIKEKNVLENIPKKHIRFAQKIFHDILQFPVMYFIKALRNLRYTSSKFYPTLDFKELHRILIHDGMRSTHPNGVVNTMTTSPNKRKRILDKETIWKHKKEQETRMAILAKKQEQENLKKGILVRRESEDSINMDWKCENTFDLLKTRKLLSLFINMFINIERQSRRIASKEQTQFYLKQAMYLVTIFQNECVTNIAEAADFKDILRKEEDEWEQMVMEGDPDLPPTTPARNSVQMFIYDQQLKNNTINLSNLNMAYNSGFQAQPPVLVRRATSNAKKNNNRLNRNSLPSAE